MGRDVRDVVVVGSSVAGTAVALGLGRAGWDVLLVDRATFPRDKVCGEGLMPHGVAELSRLGLDDALEGAPPFSGIAYHAGGRSAVGRFSRGPGRGVRRLRLDSAMREACLAEPNIEVRVGTVTALRTSADVASVDVDGESVRARVIVGADGLHSFVRRELGLGLPDPSPARYGARAHVKLAGERRERDVVDVYAAPSCEFYLTPTGSGEVNVALLCDKETSRGFAGDLSGGFWRLVATVPELAAYLDGAETINPVRLVGPLRQRVSGVVADRAVLVGDAAGFVDAITGEGMSLALASARLATDAIVAGLDADRLAVADLRAYEIARQRYARDLFAVSEIVLWWVKKPWLARHVVGNLARHPRAFDALLAVNTGEIPLTAIGVRNLVRIALGV